MIGDDTIKLLKECDAGVKMGVDSIDQVLDKVKCEKLSQILNESKEKHQQLGSKIHEMLNRFHDEPKEPNPMAKGMSWLKTNVMLAMDNNDKTIADLMTGGQPVSVTIDRILETVAKKYAITVEDLKGTKRTKEIAYARHIAVYLLRKMTDMSLPQIGKLLKRDHSTIISSLKTVEKELGANTQTDADVTGLMKEIKG